MPAYNFQEQFAEKVKSRVKRQTIRRKRKRPTKIGDRLYLYTGMRTKSCQKLLEADCLDVKKIEILKGGIDFDGHGSWVESPVADRIAHADGFRDSAEMIQWFDLMYGLPFKGVVIYW